MSNRLYVPGALNKAVNPGEPRTTAVEVNTEDGQKLLFPQVALAMISPNALEAIADAVANRVLQKINNSEPILPVTEQSEVS